MKKLLLGLVLLSGVVSLYGSDSQYGEDPDGYWYKYTVDYSEPVKVTPETPRDGLKALCVGPCEAIRIQKKYKSDSTLITLNFSKADLSKVLGCYCRFFFNKGNSMFNPK